MLLGSSSLGGEGKGAKIGCKIDWYIIHSLTLTKCGCPEEKYKGKCQTLSLTSSTKLEQTQPYHNVTFGSGATHV